MPKALVVGDDGEPWLTRGVRVLTAGGCHRVTVVLGAEAGRAQALLGSDAEVVVADDWAQGMSASLRAGLRAVAATHATSVVVTLVDLPDVGPDVVGRLLDPLPRAGTLRRAGYDGHPGHPVVLGRDHWAAILDSTTGDRGARDYLATAAVETIECGDLATGHDVDSR